MALYQDEVKEGISTLKSISKHCSNIDRTLDILSNSLVDLRLKGQTNKDNRRKLFIQLLAEFYSYKELCSDRSQETLKKLYEEYNKWIEEYDKAK